MPPEYSRPDDRYPDATVRDPGLPQKAADPHQGEQAERDHQHNAASIGEPPVLARGFVGLMNSDELSS